MKEALLIIDMVNDFVRDGAPLEVPDTRAIIPAIRREIARARRGGYPVIYLCDSHAPDDREFSRFGWPAHAVRGSHGAEIVEELTPGEDDIVVFKSSYSGFFHTKLDETLRTFGVDTLRLTGDVTHIGVLFTTADAVLREYAVSVVENGVAGTSRRDHEAALRIMKEVLGVKLVEAGSGSAPEPIKAA